MSILPEVALVSAAMAFLLVLVTKLLTDQSKIKESKAIMEEHKKKIKEAQKLGDQEEVKRQTSLMFKQSQVQFKSSTKPMMVSMVIVVIAFGWIGSNYGNFSVGIVERAADPNGGHSTMEGAITYKGGNTPIVFYDSSSLAVDENRNSVFEATERHAVGEVFQSGGNIMKADKPADGKVKFELFAAKAPFNMPYVGPYMSWFWVYLFVTLPTTFFFRKLLDVQ